MIAIAIALRIFPLLLLVIPLNILLSLFFKWLLLKISPKKSHHVTNLIAALISSVVVGLLSHITHLSNLHNRVGTDLLFSFISPFILTTIFSLVIFALLELIEFVLKFNTSAKLIVLVLICVVCIFFPRIYHDYQPVDNKVIERYCICTGYTSGNITDYECYGVLINCQETVRCTYDSSDSPNGCAIPL